MKACIFDLDGTLTNTLESMTYSVNLTLKEMGLSQITKDQCRMFVGNGARVLIEESLKVSGDPKASRIEEGMKIYGRIFDQNCTYHVTLYEGIPEMLKALKDRGIHLAVLSNKPDRQTVKVVKEIFGDNIFDYAQGQKRRHPQKTRTGRSLVSDGADAGIERRMSVYRRFGSRCGNRKECRP